MTREFDGLRGFRLMLVLGRVARTCWDVVPFATRLGLLLLGLGLGVAEAQLIVNSITPPAVTNAPGTATTYTVNYTWASLTLSATNATLTITVPDPVLNGAAGNISLVGNPQITNSFYTPATKTITFQFASPLPAGSAGSVQFTAQMRNDGTVTNGSSATFNATLSATGQPSATGSATLTASGVTHNATLSKAILGSTYITTNSVFTYQISPRDNNPSLNITNWNLVDTLPPGVVYLSSSPSGTYNATAGTVTWTSNSPAAPFNVGTAPSFTVTVYAPASAFSGAALTTYTLTNRVTTTNVFLDGVTNVVSYTNKTALSLPYISFDTISKTANSWNGQFNSPFTWTINARARGNDTANTFTLTDLIPAAFVLTAINPGWGDLNPTVVYVAYQLSTGAAWLSLPGSPFTNPSSAYATNYYITNLHLGSGVFVTNVQWTYTNVTPLFTFQNGGDVKPTLTGTITNLDRNGNVVPPTASITNFASLSATHGVTNLNLGTVSNYVTLTVAAPLVSLSKSTSAGNPAQPGQTNTWTLKLSNAATASQSLTNPVVADLLPLSLQYVPGSATGAGGNLTLTNTVVTTNYNGTGRTLVKLQYSGYLGLNNSASTTVKSYISPGVQAGTITNAISLVGWANSVIVSSSPWVADTNNLSGTGNTNLLVPTVSGTTVVTAATVASSIKSVKGQLDTAFLNYPTNGSSYAGGPMAYQETISNPGNVPLTNIVVIDILPWVGDFGVLGTTQARNSAFQPFLTGPVSGPSGVTVYYSTSNNPYRPEILGANTPGSPSDWSSVPPSDITTVRSLKFAFGPTNVLNPLDAVQLTWPLQVPATATTNTVAYNSFAFSATPAVTGATPLISEPNKVGIATLPTQPAFLGDYVWSDANNDGIQNDGATAGLNGVRVELYNASHVFQQFVLSGNGPTGQPGFYEFPFLPAGSYYVKVIPPANYVFSPKGVGSDPTVNSQFNPATGYSDLITLTAGTTNLNVDAGLYNSGTLAAVGDYVWIDRNGNGIQDEATIDGLNGVTVNLYSIAGGKTNLYGTQVTTFSSAGNPGYYNFYGVPPGQYQIQFVPPVGDTFTTQNASGSNTANDSDANSAGYTPVFSLTGGQVDNTRDAGIILPTGPLSVGNMVWYDPNADGRYDFFGGERGINNVIVSLYYDTDNSGLFTPGTDQLFESTLTITLAGEPGNYLFNNLPPGKFIVVLEAINFQPSGVLYGLTNDPSAVPDAPGYVDNVNKGYPVAGSYVASTAFSLAVGTEPTTPNSNMTLDFGLTYLTNLCSVGSTVFLDINQNGKQDAGESGIASLGIQLWRLGASGVVGGSDAVLIATTNTDGSGNYIFTNLPPTNYFIEIPTPPATARAASPVVYTGNQKDGYNHGKQPGGYNTAVSGPSFTLAPGTEPTDTTETAQGGALDDSLPGGDANGDMTEDFGFFDSSGLVAIGNTVFNDLNANGIQDAGEPGVAGVGLALAITVPGYSNVLAYTTTDANGHYFFDELAPSNYTVLVLATNFQAGGPLANFLSTPGAVATNLYNNVANDQSDHGIDASNPALNGIHSAAFYYGVGQGPIGESPTSPTGVPDANANLTIDFGFTPTYSIGNRVFLDNGAGTGGVANDGIQNGTEPGIANVVLKLFAADGSGNPIGTVLATITTDASGYYRFDGLMTGSYVVVVDMNSSGSALAGLVSSTGWDTGLALADDQNDHGIDTPLRTGSVLPGGIAGVAVTLGAGLEPTGETDLGGTSPNPPRGNGPAGDANDNLVMDFGFTPTYSIGNRVFADNGAGSGVANDGIQNGSEPGIQGVILKLFAADALGNPIGTALATTTTDSSGYYRFDGLGAGTYVVVVDVAGSGSALTGLVPSTAVSSDNTLAGDLHSHGKTTALGSGSVLPGGITGDALTLGVGLQPTIETDLGGNSPNPPRGHDPAGDAWDNLVMDFGFTPTFSLGNWVFADNGAGGGTWNNGVRDGSEPGVANVTVRLFAANAGNPIGTALATQITDANGYYRFDGLTAGAYVPVVDVAASGAALSGMISSTGASTDTTATGDSKDHGEDTPVTIDVVTSGIAGAAVTLGVGLQPTGEATYGTGQGAHGPNGDASDNLTDDFGFAPTFSIGNNVFADWNNNGSRDVGENGISGVRMLLFTNLAGAPSGSVLQSAITDIYGNYRFDYLVAGSYVVVVDQVNSPILTGWVSSTGWSTNPMGDQFKDHGKDTTVTVAGGVTGGIAGVPVTVGPGLQPTGEITGNAPGAGRNGPAGDLYDNLDMTFSFTPATYSIGNRVFLDNGAGGGVENDGIQNGFEPGISGVAVELFAADASGNPTGSVLASSSTDTSGYYRFDGLITGTYVVVVDQANSSNLAGLVSSTGVSTDMTASGDLKDHGVDTPVTVGGVVNGIASTPVTVGVGLQPQHEATFASSAGGNGPYGDTNDNLVVEFGFAPTYSVGNRVFLDDGAGTGGNANNGILDGTEAGIANVSLNLYAADGSGDPTGTALTTTNTDSNGYYRFDGIPAGSYVVVVNALGSGSALNGLQSSAVVSSDNTLAGDNHNHGENTPLGSSSVLPGGIASDAFKLGANLQPTGEATTGSGAGAHGPSGDTSDNLVIDFGFAPNSAFYSVGNRVFRDDGSGSGRANNGIQDGTEPGIAGVVMDLFHADSNGNPTGALVAATTTDTLGYYRFDNQPPGNYVVVVDVQGSGNALSGLQSSHGANTDFTITGDLKDHGKDTLVTVGGVVNGIASGAFTLGLGLQPTGEATSGSGAGAHGPTGDANDNLVVDFGFAPSTAFFSIGHRVFNDNGVGHGVENNGLQDGTESGISNVVVDLFYADNNGAPTGAILATTTTDSNGYYRFDGVGPATYVVVVDATNSPTLAGYVSSTGYTNTTTTDGQFYDHGKDTPVTLMGAVTNGIASVPVTVGTGLQPAGEATASGAGANGPTGDAYDNLTINFGFTPTYSIGNKVYKDPDDDGQPDLDSPDEPGWPNVVLYVFAADSTGKIVNTTPLATTTTDANGYYRFDGLVAGIYVVVVDQANSPVLSNAHLDEPNFPGAPDYYNKGIGYVTVGSIVNGAVSPPVTLGYGLQPLDEALASGQGGNGPLGDAYDNLTVDFGFYPLYSIGNRVFLDANNNGYQDSGESGIANVRLKLLRVADGLGNPVNTLVATTNTDAHGYYRFDHLLAGTYVVIVDQPNSPSLFGLVSSTGASTDTSITGDLHDHGLDAPLGSGSVVPGGIASTPLVIGDGYFWPTGEATEGTGAGAHGPNGDFADFLIMDFGFTPTYSIGNRVFADNGAFGGTANDGIQNGGEPGVANVILYLFAGDGVGNPTGSALATTNTDAEGYYRFDGLVTGAYVVVVDKLNSSALNGYLSSAGASSDVTITGDLKDHGRDTPVSVGAVVNGIASTAVTVGPNLQPTGEATAAAGAGANGPNGDASDNLVVEFGFAPTASAAGRVLVDVNGNGVQDAGENTGIPGVTVMLWTNGVTTVATTTTGSDGSYSFSNLPPGNYTVVETDLPGWVSTGDTEGPNDNQILLTLASGQNSTENNFLDAQPGSVSGTVVLDVNGNGVRDAGENTGISGVTVTLQTNGVTVATTTTGSDGSYSFPGVLPGSYTIVETVPGGYLGTSPVTLSATVASGQSVTGKDYLNTKPATIGDFVWHDVNGNGVQDAGEGGITDVGLTLTGSSATGVALTIYTTTDATGTYLFTAPPGTYTVSVDATNFDAQAPLAGYVATSVGKGGDPAKDSNASPSGTTPAALVEGGSDETLDFGFVKPVTIGDFVWIDLNGNGVQDAIEPGLAGVTLTLTGTDVAGDAVTDTTTSDVNGHYQFTELPGTYQVAVTTATGYTPTLTGQGTTGMGSKPSPSGTTPGTLAEGGSDQTLDFGFNAHVCVAGDITVAPPWYIDGQNRIVITFQDSYGLGTLRALRLVRCTMEGLAYDANGTLLGDFPALSDIARTTLPSGTVKVVCLASLSSGFTTGSCNAEVQDLCAEFAKTVDPLTTRLQITSGGQTQQVLTGMPSVERLVSVRNGSPGLTNLTLVVNGRSYVLAPLSDGASVSVDVGAAMVPGDGNTIILIGEGLVGATATITIGDAPAGDPKIVVQSVVLQIALSAQGVQLSWPGSVSGYLLQSRSSLAQSDGWVNWPASPQSINGRWVVAMPAKDGGQFFRLLKP